MYKVKFRTVLLFYLTLITKSMSKRHNVLFIFIDDLRHIEGIEIHLPNIEKMAANSVSFKNAFAQQALCAPSRNSILTGRKPDSLHLYDFYSYWRTAVGNFTTLPQYFKEHGYETYSVGKVFHPGKSSNFTDDYPYSWSHPPYHPPTEKYKDKPVCKDAITKKIQSNLICPVKIKDQPGKSLPDLQSLDYAVNVLKQQSNRSQPFFLAVGFHKPHMPLKYPQRYLDKVPLKKVHLPRFPQIPKDLPVVAWHPWSDVRRRDDIARLNISFPFGTMPPEWTVKVKQSYFAAVKYIDDMVGALMAYVDLNNTIVVLTSDHGWSLGENGLWAKYSNFDVALKVPLLFLFPEMSPHVVHNPVELIDIFPSLVDLSGLTNNIPKCQNSDRSTLCFEGKSLVPLMRRTNIYNGNVPHISNYDNSVSQYPRPSVYPTAKSDKPSLKDIKIMGYSIRTRRYRYTEWILFNNTLFTKDWKKVYGIELYDHMIDPDESQNVFLVPKYKKTIHILHSILKSRIG